MQSEEKIPEYIENIKKEREIWNDYFKKGLLNIPLQCPKCQKNITIKEYDIIYNPYISNSCKPKCRKILYLRINTIFSLNSKTPISLIKYIINLNLSV